MTEKKKNLIGKIVIFSLMAIVIFILVLFLKDIFVPFVKLELSNDKEGAAKFLKSKGFLGFVTVSIIEALQMVVVFIPAEFIQLTSGMSYPWYLALLLCDIGVAIGSSLIYFIVHVLKFEGDFFYRNKRIEKYEKRMKTNNTILFMYILFIMPIIPFGAICYYGANKKVPYHRYLLTCITGVIPSIITSIIMGTAVKEFITNSIPLYLLILLIILAAGILFVLLAFVLNKFFFKQNDYTPDSVFNHFYLSLSSFFFKLKNKPIVKSEDVKRIKELKGSYLLLSNHHSFVDFNYVYALEKERGISFVINAHYFKIPIFGKLGARAGMIPKKMFTPDINALKMIIKAKNGGYPIAIFPEARLSTSGKGSYIDDSTSVLAKKLNVPIVLVNTKKAYFYCNKWRKTRYRGKYEVEIKRIITPEELEKISVEELHQIISSNLIFNEFDYTSDINIKSKNKALGLENILYMCIHCKSLYTNTTSGNTMKCSCCNREYTILPNYHFDDKEVDNISVYYDEITRIEKENIDNVSLDVKVKTKIFKDTFLKVINDEGIFHLDNRKISYKSSLTNEYFEYSISEKGGIAYTVNKEFELYHNGDQYYFYPIENKKECTRVALVFEILKELECKNKNQETKE